MTRDPFEGLSESPISLHRYLYANSDPVNNVDPTGEESLIELSIVQAIDSYDSGIDAALAVKTGCDLKCKLELAGDFVMLAELGITALGSAAIGDLIFMEGYGNINDSAPGKIAFSAFGVNPVRLPGKVESVELRMEVPFNLKLSTKIRGLGNIDLSTGFTGAALAGGANYDIFEITKCGLPMGIVSMKMRLKAFKSSGVGVPSSGGASFSSELQLLKIFRFEFPIWEGSFTRKGTKSKTLGGLY